MRRTITIERSVERMLTRNSTGHICRSCQIRLASTQQRQIHSSRSRSAPRSAFIAPKTPKESTGEHSKVETSADEEATLSDVEPLKYADHTKDPNYVQALTWEGLEQVGSKAWIENQQDEGEKFEG